MVFSQAAYSKLFTSWRISTACKRFQSSSSAPSTESLSYGISPGTFVKTLHPNGKTETAVLISSRHLEIVLFCLEQGPLTRSLRSLFNHSIQVLFSSVFSVLFFSGLRRHIFLILRCRLLGVKNGDGNVS